MALRHLFDPSTPSPKSTDSAAAAAPAAPPTAADLAETETVRRIVLALQQVDVTRRRYLAGFAYVLARAAHADLEITEDEARQMEAVVSQIGGLPEAQAVLVVEIARNQSELYSGTEDYLVTREFNKSASDEEKRAAVAACFAVAATDHEITAEEYAELTEIAEELGLSRAELNVIRADYRDQLTAIKAMRQQQADAAQAAEAAPATEAAGS
jgi:tellurite resistance protein